MARRNSTYGDLAANLDDALEMEGIPLRCKLDQSGNLTDCSRVRKNTPTKRLAKNEAFVFAHAKSPGRVAAGKARGGPPAEYRRKEGGALPAAGAGAAKRAASRAAHIAAGGVSAAQMAAREKFSKAAKSCGGKGLSREKFNECVGGKLSSKSAGKPKGKKGKKK